MKTKSVDKRAAELWDLLNDPFKSGEERQALIVEALRDQIGDCSEAARRRYEEAEINRREFQDCGRTVANHWIAKKDTAARIIEDINALAAPYEPKRNPNIG